MTGWTLTRTVKHFTPLRNFLISLWFTTNTIIVSITSIDPIVGDWIVTLEAEEGFIPLAQAVKDLTIKVKHRMNSEQSPSIQIKEMQQISKE